MSSTFCNWECEVPKYFQFYVDEHPDKAICAEEDVDGDRAGSEERGAHRRSEIDLKVHQHQQEGPQRAGGKWERENLQDWKLVFSFYIF